MKKLSIFMYSLFFSLFIISCSSSDKTSIDKLPPNKPILIPHLGDMGDNLLIDGYLINDSNNGLSPLPDGDRLRLQWSRLIDNDLSVIRIYRYPESLNPNPVKVDSIRWDNEEYIDRLENTGTNPATQTNWHYFIEVVDMTGNSTVSDTVNFTLINKPLLLSPEPGDTLISSSQLSFNWVSYNTNISRLRVLILKTNDQFSDGDLNYKEYVWHFDESNITENSEFNINYTGEPLPAGTYYWRVDAQGAMDENLNYNSGSKSEERKFIIQ